MEVDFDENKEHEKPMKPMCVVSLFGQPGAGKSTLAAYIFAKLKMLGVNCELVTEFAKDKVWEQNNTALANQVYVFAKQYYRLSRCADKVDVVITDSPLALSPFYNKDKDIHEPLKLLARRIAEKYNNLNYFVKRVKKYNPVGRLETEEESNQKAIGLKNMLDEYNMKYKVIDGDLMSADIVVQDVMELLKKGN